MPRVRSFACAPLLALGLSVALPVSGAAAIDRLLPVIRVAQKPPSATSSSSATISFTVSDNSGRVKPVTCARDGGAYASCTSPVALANLAEGAHKLSIRAGDFSNNTATVTVSWTIDKTPPVVKITSAPAASTTSQSAGVSFTGTDSRTGVSKFECSLDASPFGPCKSPVSYAGLSYAAHGFAVRATDRAGNTSQPATASWTVTPPAPPPPPPPPTLNGFISDTGIYSYRTYLDRSYGSDPQQRLDIYVPTIAGVSSIPVVVYIHGGAYVWGDKRDSVAWYQELARRGVAAVLVNYRLAGESYAPGNAQLEDMVYDIKGALRWVVANAPAYKLNPNYIFVMGESAGGHFSSLMGTTVGMAQLEGTVGGNTGVLARIAGVVDLYGPTDILLEDAYLEANNPDGLAFVYPNAFGNCDPQTTCASRSILLSSSNKTSPSSAPALILHGTVDTEVPLTNSQEYYSGLVAAGVPAKLVLAPGYGHDPRIMYDFSETIFAFIRNIAQGRLPF